MQIDNRASNWMHLSPYSPTHESHFGTYIFLLFAFVLVLFPFFTIAEKRDEKRRKNCLTFTITFVTRFNQLN